MDEALTDQPTITIEDLEEWVTPVLRFVEGELDRGTERMLVVIVDGLRSAYAAGVRVGFLQGVAAAASEGLGRDAHTF